MGLCLYTRGGLTHVVQHEAVNTHEFVVLEPLGEPGGFVKHQRNDSGVD